MDPDYIPVWLRTPIPALEDRTPLEAMGRGDYDALARIVSALEDPPAG